jgi:peptidoglycan/LPS O-acetylase OafA/YrhL
MIPFSLLFVAQYMMQTKFAEYRVISFVSYSSFAVFMFHRPILSAVNWIFTHLHIENALFLLPVYVLVVFPFIVFPISYVIQKSADKAIAAPLRNAHSYGRS